MQSQLEKIVEPLVKWYQENKRELPWRQDKNPYHVWISEIMLQQTRIEAVIEYYHRFMKQLPTVEKLSRISEENLLKLWEGLGYYSRARNLKKAAEIVREEYDGKIPQEYAQLRKLPGIGDYTAGAIASICFQEKVTAVDGNVLRVISRVLGSKKNVLLPETKKEMEQKLQKVLPEQSGDFNEGLMELGETICLPNGQPACDICPIRESCTAFQKGLTQELPVRIKEMKRKTEEKTVFLLMNEQQQIAIEKREAKGLLAGMYQFPNVEHFLTEKEMKQQLKKWHLTVKKIKEVKEAKHVFTHVDWYLKGVLVQVKSQDEAPFQWVSLKALSEQYPLPTAFQKLIPFPKK